MKIKSITFEFDKPNVNGSTKVTIVNNAAFIWDEGDKDNSYVTDIVKVSDSCFRIKFENNRVWEIYNPYLVKYYMTDCNGNFID